MALRCLRLRRSLLSLSSLTRSFTSPSPLHNSLKQPSFLCSQSRLFTPSRISFASERKYKLYQEGDEITEDTILFPGCDYNHWLITVDFPKDPRPSPEEMVATYERICSQGLNISVEEAKKKIYACSTTTYQGFQAVMTEEESEKFKDVPGVVFVLPDSYIDPVNQQYGGDKYENGVITPRPPPVQFQNRRNRQPRYNNQGGQYDQQSHSQGGQLPYRQGNPQYGQEGSTQGGLMPHRQGNPQYGQQGSTQGGQMPNWQGNPQYDQQGSVRGGGRNFGPRQDLQQQQNYGPPGQGERMRVNTRDYSPGGRDGYQDTNRGPSPLPQGSYNQGQQGNYNSQDLQPQQNYGPPGLGERLRMNTRDYAPGGRDGYLDTNRGPSPPPQGSYNQGQQGNYNSQDQRTTPQGGWGNYGTPGQRDVRGDNQNYYSPNAGNYGQDPVTGYEQGKYAPGQRGLDRDQVKY